jgi:glycosyltransferase involved in cell wall biosynthesis
MNQLITFCQMTQNSLMDTKNCLQLYLPYVNKAIIIDGGSDDDSIYYFRNWAEKEPKLEFHMIPWRDNFSQQRNEYLSRVPDNTWALVSDPDEIFEDNLLRNLQVLVSEATKRNKDMIGFQCRSVSYKGPHKVHESLDNYWKRLLFKKYPKTHYIGNPHEGLADHPHQIMDTKFIYEHVKQENVIWKRGWRNAFTNGGGPNLGNKNPYWIKMRQLCSQLGINDWHTMHKYMLKGNIDQRIKDEFISYIALTEIAPGITDGLSEHREAYKYYFRILHPNEEPAQLKNIHIP